MEPLTITTGVVGLLSSLTTLSLRINEFSQDIIDAPSEIRLLKHEVEALRQILDQLEAGGTRNNLGKKLEKELEVVVERLGAAVADLEKFLRKSMAKRFRGTYWAFSGKTQCGKLCRRLESYKATLNITLTMADVISGHKINETTDQILKEIDQLRRHVSKGDDNYLLQRYLDALETTYEGSTIAPSGETESPHMSEYELELETTEYPSLNDTKKPVATEHPSPNNTKKPVATESSKPERNPSKTIAIRPAPSPKTPSSANRATAQPKNPSPSAPQTKSTFAQSWSNSSEITGSPSHIRQMPEGLGTSVQIFIAKDDYFACWAADKGFGTLITGRIGQQTEIKPYSLNGANEALSIETDKDQKISSMAFGRGGRLIAACQSEKRLRRHAIRSKGDSEHVIIAYDSSNYGSVKTISQPILGFLDCQSRLSGDGSVFAHHHGSEVVVYDVGRGCVETTTIKMPEYSSVERIAWSQDAKTLIVGYGALGGGQIAIYSIPGGNKTSQIGLGELPLNKSMPSSWLDFFFSGSNDDLVFFRGKSHPPDLLDPTRAWMVISSRTINPSELWQDDDFFGIINIKKKTMSLKHAARGLPSSYSQPAISPDGSVIVGAAGNYATDTNVKLWDVSSGKNIATIRGEEYSMGLKQLHALDGHRILVLLYVNEWNNKRWELHVWEPKAHS